MTQFRLPLAAVILCLSIASAFAQAAYIRPLSPPPPKPAHGFYIDSIGLEPEDLDTDNGLYTATVHLRLQDMPDFEAKSQAMTFKMEHVKADQKIQDLRNEAKKQALARFGDIIGTLQTYRDEFGKGRR